MADAEMAPRGTHPGRARHRGSQPLSAVPAALRAPSPRVSTPYPPRQRAPPPTPRCRSSHQACTDNPRTLRAPPDPFHGRPRSAGSTPGCPCTTLAWWWSSLRSASALASPRRSPCRPLGAQAEEAEDGACARAGVRARARARAGGAGFHRSLRGGDQAEEEGGEAKGEGAHHGAARSSSEAKNKLSTVEARAPAPREGKAPRQGDQRVRRRRLLHR